MSVALLYLDLYVLQNFYFHFFFRPGNDRANGRNSFSEVETYAQEVILHKSQSDPKKHFKMYVAGMSWSDLGITSWYSNEV